MISKFVRGALLGAPLLFTAAAAEPPAVEWVAELRLPAGGRHGGSCIGGLSAIDRDPAGGYVLLSDARADPRAFFAGIVLVPAAGDAPARIEVTFRRVLPLLGSGGKGFAAGTIDPEGLAVAGGDAWISSEGVAARGIPPFVNRFSLADGKQREALPIPPAFLPQLEEGTLVGGVADNRAFEGLTLTPDGHTLWVGTEATLVHERGGPRLSALLRYELGGDAPRVSGEYRYPMRRPPVPGTSVGLVELLALEDGRLLALERSFGALTGMAVAIFEWSPTEATGDTPPVVSKRRWVSLTELGIAPENIEAITEVPGDGEAIDLLLVSDNNDPGCSGRGPAGAAADTQFLWLRVGAPAPGREGVVEPRRPRPAAPADRSAPGSDRSPLRR